MSKAMSRGLWSSVPRLCLGHLILVSSVFCEPDGFEGLRAYKVGKGRIETTVIKEPVTRDDPSSTPVLSWCLRRFRFCQPSRVLCEFLFYSRAKEGPQEARLNRDVSFQGWMDHGREIYVNRFRNEPAAFIVPIDRRPYAQGIMSFPEGFVFRLASVASGEGTKVRKVGEIPEIGAGTEWTELVPADGRVLFYVRFDADGHLSKVVQKYKKENLFTLYDLTEYKMIGSAAFPHRILVERRTWGSSAVLSRTVHEVTRASFTDQEWDGRFPDGFLPRGTPVFDETTSRVHLASAGDEIRGVNWDPVWLAGSEAFDLGFDLP